MPEPPLTVNPPTGSDATAWIFRLGTQHWPYPDDIDGVCSRVVTMAQDGAWISWISKKYQGFTVQHVSVVDVAATGRIFAFYQTRSPGGSMAWDRNEKHLIGVR